MRIALALFFLLAVPAVASALVVVTVELPDHYAVLTRGGLAEARAVITWTADPAPNRMTTHWRNWRTGAVTPLVAHEGPRANGATWSAYARVPYHAELPDVAGGAREFQLVVRAYHVPPTGAAVLLREAKADMLTLR